MKQRKISQANARHYKKRVAELEEQARNRYGGVHGTHVRSINISDQAVTKHVLINTLLLGFHLRARLNGESLELFAVK